MLTCKVIFGGYLADYQNAPPMLVPRLLVERFTRTNDLAELQGARLG